MIVLNTISLSIILTVHTLKNIKSIFHVALLIKLCVLIINFVKKLICLETTMLLIYLLSINYCRKVVKNILIKILLWMQKKMKDLN